VNDAFGVCRIQRLGNLDGEGEHCVRIQRSSGNAILNLVDGADVRMVQCRSSFGLALKAA